MSPLDQLLTKPSSGPVGFQPMGVPQSFPDPIFPQRPELLGPIDENDVGPACKAKSPSNSVPTES